MQGNKSFDQIGSNPPIKNNRKYIPTPEEAKIIMAYFLHNNFQDFNTWQQISKSKCEFQYNEIRDGVLQCKAILKWDNLSMPIIVQSAESKNKKNGKRKAMFKLVENLIFLGLIGYGFRDQNFVNKLSKRRQQNSESSSSEEESICEQVKTNMNSSDVEGSLKTMNQKNVQYERTQLEHFLSPAIRDRNFGLVVKIIRFLQKKDISDLIVDEKCLQMGPQERWQDYCEKQLKDPFSEDLTDFLRYYQLQLPEPQSIEKKKEESQGWNERRLPSEALQFDLGNNFLFHSFYPIEYTLSFSRKLERMNSSIKRKPSYFSDFYRQMALPNFEFDQHLELLPYKVVEKIYNIILEFSHSYTLVHQLLLIVQKQITSCSIDSSEDDSQADLFYLRQKGLLTAEFAFLLSKKAKLPALSIEGMIHRQGKVLIFTPKQPQEIVSQKISKKVNLNQFYEMPEFATEEFVLLVSKINSDVVFIAKIKEIFPVIHLTLLSYSFCEEREPYTIFKLANAKVFNRVSKAIIHTAKSGLKLLRNQTYFLRQPPTFPIVTVLCELISEWIALRETILIVSDQIDALYAALVEKGFKITKITAKVQQKSVSKNQIVCCTPLTVCADVLRNYAFTRVVIEGAERITQTMSLLAIDKGCKKLFLIGDELLPPGQVFSQFSKNRNMQSSLLSWINKKTSETYTYTSKTQHQPFEKSILKYLNNFFYRNKLRNEYSFETPLIKGFPWPSSTQRVAFIHHSSKNSNKSPYLNTQAEICALILFHVLKSGFVGPNDVACRAVSANGLSLLRLKLEYLFKNLSQPFISIESEKIAGFLSGSRFRQKDLCVFMSENRPLKIEYLNAALQEGRRGIIIIGDLNSINKNGSWTPVLRWAKESKLILQLNEDKC